MRLTVMQKGKKVNEFKFANGPIYIGRQMGSQVFLPDRSISRQHAVIYTSNDGSWIAEDLDSANKTYLNKHAIHRSQIKDGDTLNIGDFNIKIKIGEGEDEKKSHNSIHLGDTVAEINPDIHTEVRQPNSKTAPMIKIPAFRAEDLLQACRSLRKARSLKSLHGQLVDIVRSQFTPLNSWAALRKEPDGPMDIEGGRKTSSEIIKLDDLMMQDKVNEAIAKKRYILVPQMPKGKVRSAIICPILYQRNCYGALYANNSTMHEAYDMADLDYLMLISIQAAALVEIM